MKANSMKIVLCNLFILITIFSYSQKYTISGYIKDSSNGEMLIGATIIVKEKGSGTVANVYGYYSITLENGDYTFEYKYLGYEPITFKVNLNRDIKKSVELKPMSETLDEVLITGERTNENVVSTRMSVDKLDQRTIEKIPVLMGEVDMMKSLQLLPGVKATSGISSGMSVRGGARDQNLIQLDEANVYNASHLGGIFSVFNNDAIKNVELYKGFIPAMYGGRLASMLDVRMRDGNMKKFTGNGGVGLISSRLTLEGPIAKDRASFIISGRRTYLDQVIKFAGLFVPDLLEFPIHFYDLNAKGNVKLNDNNRLYLSGYFGRDVFGYDFGGGNETEFDWGNYTGTLRWNHLFSKRVFSNFTLIASNYDYVLFNKVKISDDRKYSFTYDAFAKDFGYKADFGFFINQNNTLKFGATTLCHDFNMGKMSGKVDTVSYSFSFPRIKSLEHALYISNEQKITPNISVDYGLRFSVFNNIGEGVVETYEKQVTDQRIDYVVTGEKEYGKGEIYHTYWNPEPRIGATFVLSEKQSIKASYSRTVQYLFVASNSSVETPIDVWICSNPNIKPQTSDQYTVGYFRNFFGNMIETSLEAYYKEIQNQIQFREFAMPQFNEHIIEDLRTGIGKAYGIELLVKKPGGRLNGWISYTYSTSLLKIKDIQEKGWYPSPYDRPHDFTIVGILQLNKKISVSSNFTFKSGNPITAPAARGEYGYLVFPFYPGRNKARVPAYHRLDFAMTYKIKDRKRWQGEWVFSVYNVYAHKNPDAIYFERDDLNPYKTRAMQTTYFTFFPSVSFNFKF